MNITCDENGIVKWEEEPRIIRKEDIKIEKVFLRKTIDKFFMDIFCKVIKPIDKIDLNLEIKELKPEVRKLRDRARVVPATFLQTKINLLPEKEYSMRTRYAVVNLKDKVEFEKKWEMPYGYNNCPHIGFSQKEAINWLNRNLGQIERNDYVVEKHYGGKIDVVWKPGGKLIEEEDEYDLEEF